MDPTAAHAPLNRRERPAVRPDAPAGLLVLLHGRGADADDLFPLLDMLDPERHLHGVTLEAPFAPAQELGNHWYVVRRVGHPDEGTFGASLGLLERDVDALLAQHGLDHSRLVLGGFSQGAVMSIAVAVGAGRPAPALLLPWSGFVPTVATWEIDPDAAAGLPVLLTHGSLDPVITVDFGHASRELLEAAGAAVEYREPTMAHELDPETVSRARELIAERVPTERVPGADAANHPSPDPAQESDS